MTYYGKIMCTIDSQHPDFSYIKDWHKDKIFHFEDTYTFNDKYPEDYMIDYIKKDLSLVAGGGYNAKHIHNVTFDIRLMR